ncbi:MAG: hypothetical protein SO206_05925, partial [Bacilli bacterium]|nr:hypothetical protein [Bacilli bacterium]
MAKKLSTNQKLYKAYEQKSHALFLSKASKDLLNNFSNGHNAYLKLNRFESSSMDMSWIKRIEDCIPTLGEIIGNPKKTIQTLAEVVQVEKVKKIGIETVQHLSSHTQYIKTVDENGNVTPSKLLNIYNDDFYATYENKFIATLLRRLLVFVEKRYEFIMTSATMKDVSLLYVKNHTEIDDQVIDIETKVKYSRPSEQVASEKMKGFIHQIEDIRKYLKFFMHSEFMEILRHEKDVRNPILQTNIIRKNPLYHKCYLLWLFIERYRESSIEVKVEENYQELTQKEIDVINRHNVASFALLKGKDIDKPIKKQKVYKPKILNTYDDLIYKPAYYDGPIEYIRVDDKYLSYENQVFDIPTHPSKPVGIYEEEKYVLNKYRKEKQKQIDALKKRKEAELERYNKLEEKAALREIERDKYVDQLAEKEIREEAIKKVEDARKKIVKAAKGKTVAKKQDKKVEEEKNKPAPILEKKIEEDKENKVEEKPKKERKPRVKKETNTKPRVKEEKVVDQPKEEISSPVQEEKPVIEQQVLT